MRTTLLNPTAWLLTAVIVSAAAAAVRGGTAQQAFARVVRVATLAPVLGVLALLAGGGLVSRIAMGYVAPGAYAEEVLAARAFLAERQVYGGDDRQEFRRWLREEPPVTDPWTLPGLSSCQANALEHRPEFFTSQAHSPVLLLASVPIVRLAGGRGLYLALTVLSVAGLGITWLLLVRVAGLGCLSRNAALLAVALAGWQPVVAGLKQGDAVLVSAALVVAAWYLSRGGRDVAGGVLAGIAAALAVPAAAVLLATVRRPRALAGGLATIAIAAAVTVMVGGPMIVVDFARNVAAAAAVYAAATPNYAAAARLAAAGVAGRAVVMLVAASVVVVTAWQARDVDRMWAICGLMGLLFAPLAWSQHMTLALVPLVVLLSRAVGLASSLPLAIWALLALALSLPDPAVALVSAVLQAGRVTPWPIVPLALAVLCAWLVLARAASPASSREAWARS